MTRLPIQLSKKLGSQLPKGGAATCDAKEWLPVVKAKAEMLRLCGTWKDQRGSLYTVGAGSTSGLAVSTVRPDGETRHKEGLVHLDWSSDALGRDLARVVWGLGPPTSYYNIRTFDGKTLVWERSGNASFRWERVKAAGRVDNTMEKDCHLAAVADPWKRRGSGDSKLKMTAGGTAVHRAPWAHLAEPAISTCSTKPPPSPRASFDQKAQGDSNPKMAAGGAPVHRAPWAHLTGPAVSTCSTEPPPSTTASTTPLHWEQLVCPVEEKVTKVRDITGMDKDKARELLIASGWDLEKAVRDHVRISSADSPPHPRQPPSAQRSDIAVGDEVWAYFSDQWPYNGQWHPADIYGLQPDGFIQVLWRDGTISTMPEGLLAKRGKSVQPGDSVIAYFCGEWNLASVNHVFPSGTMEVLWDDGAVAEVPSLHTFLVPE